MLKIMPLLFFKVKVVVYLCSLVILVMTTNAKSDQYLQKRAEILKEEEKEFSGGQENLTENEEKVNRYLLQLKQLELWQFYNNSSEFLPARNFLEAREEIDKSEVFKFIRKLPKGASLHTHMLAAVNVDYIIKNFTYMDHVYGCRNEMGVFKLRVMESPKEDANCSWKSLKTYRKEYEERGRDFDLFLRNQMALNHTAVNQSKNEVWTKFKNTFSCIYDLVSYRPFFQRYIYRLLEELYEDNVFYTELRGTFMPLYDLSTTYDTKVFFDTFIETVEDFKSTHPNFMGVKYIHCIYRGVDPTTVRANLSQLRNFFEAYPDFVAGLDFVGQEEEGHNIIDFYAELLEFSKDLKFFFHAGETNQFGHVDLNLVDAMLLNCSRIGHGFALAKHPKLIAMGMAQGVAVELSPISNQVLKLNEDPRNHPASVLLSQDYPVVISNDDPAAWDATGLSYDWYVTFMSMTWKNQGLRVLKKWAKDSIEFSAMTDKSLARGKWHMQWDDFVDRMAETVNVSFRE
ncbi:adenosine deaminase 2-like [Euwallacea similis]|uniref:adenosine deaminase 2-like n=1 Tax=Euwallacea similis TaxID=1736056 RepID=UPI00344FA024